MQLLCIVYRCCGYILESDISSVFPQLSSKRVNLEAAPLFFFPLVVIINQPRFHRCFAALSLIVWFMQDVSSCAASVRARDVLPPLSIKVQVVTMVWHSLSACGFAGLAPEQPGSIGCHIQPLAAVKDGRTGDECCPPVCVIKPP